MIIEGSKAMTTLGKMLRIGENVSLGPTPT